MPIYLNTTKTDGKEKTSVRCKKWVYGNTTAFGSHYHEDIEIISVINGTLRCTADSNIYTLSAGDTILFNAYSLHSGFSLSAETSYLCIQFNPSNIFCYQGSSLKEACKSLNRGTSVFDVFYPADKDGDKLLSICDEIHRNYELQTPTGESSVLAATYSLLAVLFNNHYIKTKPKSSSKPSNRFVQNSLMFIADNYYKNISVNDISTSLFISSSHFSHQFRKHFGTTFANYLRQYRIECAIRDFSTSNRSIKEISESVGFDDYCYFSSAFKEYTGFSPSDYFKNNN